MLLIDLPPEIILNLHSYIVTNPTISAFSDFRYYEEENWRQFLNLTHHWREIKRKTCHYHLNYLYSFEFAQNISFRKHICHDLVLHPYHQVSVYFDRAAQLSVEQLTTLNGVHAINLTENFHVTDVSMLTNVHSLFLAGTQIVELVGLSEVRVIDASNTDVAEIRQCFEKLHTLILSDSVLFTNTAMLGSIHTLDLSGCVFIRDVSHLSSVHTLNLSNCALIEDVSPLQTVNILNLSHCERITDVSMLGNIYNLNLEYCQGITDVSALGNINTLSLRGCNGISDVSALINVQSLNLSRCLNITDVSMLGNIQKLNLSHCYGIIDVSALGNVKSLILRNCKKVKDVSKLGNVQELDLSCCKNLIGLEYLGNVPLLTLF